jgi:hypothetical protein
MTTNETTVATGTPQAPPKGWMVTLFRYFVGVSRWEPHRYRWCKTPDEVRIAQYELTPEPAFHWQITVAPLGGAEEWVK